MRTEELELAEALEHLKYDPQQVQDGINYAQWEEWAGEEVTLTREDSAWVWAKLKELDRVKEERILLRKVYETSFYIIRGASISFDDIRSAFRAVKDFDEKKL